MKVLSWHQAAAAAMIKKNKTMCIFIEEYVVAKKRGQSGVA